jgi:hypothetical protein
MRLTFEHFSKMLLLSRLFFVVLFLAIAPPHANAAMMESATMGPTGQGAGTPISKDNLVGWRFQVNTPLMVTEVGGHLGQIELNLFAAIVKLTNVESLPPGAPFESASTVAHTLFTPPLGTAETRVPFSAVLLPGSYALIFGSGNFEAVGSGFIPNAQQTNIAPTQTRSFISWRQTLPGRYEWTSGLLNNLRFLVVTNELPPTDFNRDGRVTGLDLPPWKNTFAMATPTGPKGDADGDSDVDGADFLAWQRSLSQPSPAPTPIASVPEPSGALTAMSGLAALLSCGFRVQRSCVVP